MLPHNVIDKSWPWVIKNPPNHPLEPKNWPKISIVTPTYNQAAYIEETILSVIHQNYPNLQYIIIDGGSTDGTVNIIKKYEHLITHWISEPDQGQVDAIEKGLKFCDGELFNWINSDDLLEENALFNIAKVYLQHKSVKIIAGGCTHFTEDRNQLEPTYVRDLTFEGLISEKSYFQQPSQWLAIQRLGKLNINPALHYAFDWGMILNFDLKPNEIEYPLLNLSYFREHEDAKTFKHGISFEYEKLKIVKKFLQNTTSFHRRKRLTFYLFKLSSYLKIVEEVNKNPKSTFINFLWFGLSSPSVLLRRFYLGHLKNLWIEKED